MLTAETDAEYWIVAHSDPIHLWDRLLGYLLQVRNQRSNVIHIFDVVKIGKDQDV